MKNKIIIAIVCLASMSMYSQKVQVAKADKNYDKFAYVDAIKTYERIFEKGYKTPDMLQKLGNAYYFKADLDNAAKWYGELFTLTQDVAPEYYYRYAQSLKSVKDYKKADEMMAAFHKKVATTSEVNCPMRKKITLLLSEKIQESIPLKQPESTQRIPITEVLILETK